MYVDLTFRSNWYEFVDHIYTELTPINGSSMILHTGTPYMKEMLADHFRFVYCLVLYLRPVDLDPE